MAEHAITSRSCQSRGPLLLLTARHTALFTVYERVYEPTGESTQNNNPHKS
jgi:hypothetical protein